MCFPYSSLNVFRREFLFIVPTEIRKTKFLHQKCHSETWKHQRVWKNWTNSWLNIVTLKGKRTCCNFNERYIRKKCLRLGSFHKFNILIFLCCTIVNRFVPSKADLSVFEALGKAPTGNLAHVQRWYRHIASFTTQERSAWVGQALPQVAGGKPTVAAAAGKNTFRKSSWGHFG